MKIYSHAIHRRFTINWRHCLVSLLTSNNKTGMYKVPLILSMHECFLISRRSFIIISSIIGMLTFYWWIKLLPMFKKAIIYIYIKNIKKRRKKKGGGGGLTRMCSPDRVRPCKYICMKTISRMRTGNIPWILS